jgi:hypothetical protein
MGTAAAATAGAPLDIGEIPESAIASSRQNFAIVLTGESRAAVLLRPEAPSAMQRLTGIHAGADRVELSPGGTAAAFYFPAERLVQIVSGLPGRPSEPVDVSLVPLRNPMASFAVSDDGAILLCLETSVEGNADAAAAVVMSAAGDLSRIVLSGAPTAVAFREGSHDALLATVEELVLLRDAATGVRMPLGKGTIAPTALAFAPQGDRAILADARTGRIAVESLDARGEASAILECHCRPTGLFRLNGEAAWRLNEPSRAGMRLLDLAGGRARVLTLPPPVESR